MELCYVHINYACCCGSFFIILNRHIQLFFIKQMHHYSISDIEMSCQTFLISPKFNKKLIYNSSANKYQEFSNAYIYSFMIKTENSIPNCANICHEATKEWNKIKSKGKSEIDNIIKNYLA